MDFVRHIHFIILLIIYVKNYVILPLQHPVLVYELNYEWNYKWSFRIRPESACDGNNKISRILNIKIKRLDSIWNIRQQNTGWKKGTVSRNLLPPFLNDSQFNHPDMLKYFQIWLQFCWDTRMCKKFAVSMTPLSSVADSDPPGSAFKKSS